ncbi:MAG: hemin uptake protein HemP [Alphaproteobacteria bacterium]|nr:hemin uptake protein HemP [Alphaproteobacteria bacterium]MBN9555967.1 hemin uptake protein HemP [Alphaproteobacteria bacterium]MBN9566266.1 hemin uptake protein HemP [Alphaproteobacteria bacterium]MBN9572110.1 hemin uptake protein HemP [Alphaproteobacteria bacterium]MBN9578103.1 hemin uptake protein HemP [Alphaproteobacteria bacterium]
MPLPKISTPKIDVQALLQGGREAILLHQDQEYRLRLTSTGKLILTK